MTASEKQTVITTESVVNSVAFEQTVNAATSVTVGNSGVINSTIKTNTASTSANQGKVEAKKIDGRMNFARVVARFCHFVDAKNPYHQ